MGTATRAINDDFHVPEKSSSRLILGVVFAFITIHVLCALHHWDQFKHLVPRTALTDRPHRLEGTLQSNPYAA